MVWSGPDFSALDRGDVGRWTPNLKAKLIRRYDAGLIGLNDLLARYGITLEEFDAWRQRFRVAGRQALKETSLQASLPGLEPRPVRPNSKGARHG